MNKRELLMKMKSLFLAVLLCAPLTAAAQDDVEINATNFPDENFREYLLSQQYGEDGVITGEEIRHIFDIDVSGRNISSLKGIEHFTKLDRLNCSNNLLTELDVSGLEFLYWLDCSCNQIKEDAMNELIGSLSKRNYVDEETLEEITKGMLFIYEYRNDGNVCTKAQVAAAKAKGWFVYFYTEYWYEEFDGIDPNAMPIDEANFPDEDFRNYLLRQPYGKDLGLSQEELDSITTMNVSAANLKGIEFFAALKVLTCNKVAEIDLSKNTALMTLNIGGNFTSLDLSKNTALTTLNISGNLTALDLSKNTALTTLIFSGNLTALDLSNHVALTTLECRYGQFTSLNVSGCTALPTLDCSYNRIRTLNVSGCTALTTLNCSYNSTLMTLDISTNTALTTLLCYGCDLMELKLSTNTPLVTLNCEDNSFTALDLSNNTTLTTLHCQQNYQLISLDVSGCTALKTLDCSYNLNVAYLNVSGCTALDTLNCEINQIAELDLSGCVGLTMLNCPENQISALDVSNCPVLSTLNCGGNQLTALDVSNCPVLSTLNCGGNQLTTLDVSKCTALTVLYCYGNQLSTLDISKCPALTRLSCDNNLLTTLDIPKNTVLEELSCGNNQFEFTTMDLSGCTALTTLSYGGTPSLDVSGCTALTNLRCRGLTSLNVSGCTALNTLDCSENQLTSLDISSCKALRYLACDHNFIKPWAMEAIINSLPDNPDGEMDTLIAYRPQINITDAYDHNMITKSQVRAAKLKGWLPLFWYHGNLVAGKRWAEYEGSEDLDPNLSGILFDSEHFPDPKFLIYQLRQNYGNDGILTEDEVKEITTIDVRGYGFSSLKGIECFTALKQLYCTNNQLTALDVSGCTELSRIECSRNQINEEAMDAFISSLPRKDRPSVLYVYDNTLSDEGNVFTNEYVAAAKARNWTPYYFHMVGTTAWTWEEYEYEEQSDGINALYTDKESQNVIYTISGVRLSTTNVSDLPSGLYIINGRKHIVK